MDRLPPNQPLAPVQQIMLRDSIAEPDAGHHVEQLEITFSRQLSPALVDAAWRTTLASCEVLRTAFAETAKGQFIQSTTIAIPPMEVHSSLHPNHAKWLQADRQRIILRPDRVPWRTAFWPDARRWLWTFHHALLDGRSIARILHVFLSNLENIPSEKLALSVWHPPSEIAVKIAAESFQRIRRECPPQLWPTDFNSKAGPAIRHMGAKILKELEYLAAESDVTVATVVTWAWGQALASFLRTDRVLVEQLRAGAPQPGTAGFTMHVLPLRICRTSADALPTFRAELLAMRAFESVSPDDFPAEIYPNVAAAPVIMVEHASLSHALRDHVLLTSVKLHERPADFPSATAFLHPDLRLKVEGPHRHALLARWGAVLESQNEWPVDSGTP